jgi:hypothetical protein
MLRFKMNRDLRKVIIERILSMDKGEIANMVVQGYDIGREVRNELIKNEFIEQYNHYKTGEIIARLSYKYDLKPRQINNILRS